MWKLNDVCDAQTRVRIEEEGQIRLVSPVGNCTASNYKAKTGKGFEKVQRIR